LAAGSIVVAGLAGEGIAAVAGAITGGAIAGVVAGAVTGAGALVIAGVVLNEHNPKKDSIGER